MTKEKIKILKNSVISEFSSKEAQEKYIEKAEGGLWKSEKELIDKYFKPSDKILDLGCGTGRTTIALQDLGYKVIGIDLTPKMIESAKKIAKKKKVNIDYRIGDATNLKFANNSFDCALFSNQGWTQIPGEEYRLKALKEVDRILKKNGIYIFSIHERKIFGKRFFYWLWKWIKCYVLRPLGVNIEEIDFGDRFFKREFNGLVAKDKQYIHIASISEVNKLLNLTNLQIIYLGEGLSEHSGSHPTFFVCKKIVKKE